jgi:RimJ/RimL family protein N-acetyltransferase
MECFYLIGLKYQNTGYSKEASKAMLKYGLDVLGSNEIMDVCMKENIASERVKGKIGLKFKYIQEGLTDVN